jgi:hypothetical protein
MSGSEMYLKLKIFKTFGMNCEGLEEILDGDFANTCAEHLPLISMG